MIRLLPGESLTSALVRLAVDTIAAPRDLAREASLTRLRGRQGRPRDERLDVVDWPAVGDDPLLARWLRCDPGDIRAATLWHYRTLPGLQEGPGPVDPMWRERRTQRFWIALDRDRHCPACLAEEPAFRLVWRLRPLTVCPRHAVVLRDGCHRCGAAQPLQAHLRRTEPLVMPSWALDAESEEGWDMRWAGWPTVARHCGVCGADLAAGAVTALTPDVSALFRPLEAALTGAPFPADTPAALCEPQQYLANAYHLARILLATARRGYGEPACLGLFRAGRRPPTVGADADGVLANVEDAHAQSMATFRALRRWPDSLRELDTGIRRRADYHLLGVGERYMLPEAMTVELRRATGRATRALLEIDLARHALGGEPGPPLRADEFLRLLAPLWRGDGGAPPLALRDAESQTRRTAFPPHATLRRVCDALLAAVEGDATIPTDRDCPPDLLRAFRDRWDQDPAFEPFLAAVRAVAEDRRDGGLDAPSAVFVAPDRPEVGLTDHAWLRARPQLPVVRLAERLGARTGRPMDWRGLLGQVASRVCAVVGDVPPATHLTGKLAAADEAAVWRGLHALVDLAGEWPDGGATIARPILTDAVWAATGLDWRLRGATGRGRRTTTTPRMVLETLLDSWLTSESIAASAAMARTGITHRTGPLMDWSARWLASGELAAALDALIAVESAPTHRFLYRLVHQAAQNG